eukprot:s637_g18.t1
MLSKYGADGDTRLILGHYQTHKGASEVDATDTQSAPVRVLGTMLRDIRRGHFRPDDTGSGMVRACEPDTVQATNVPVPVTTVASPAWKLPEVQHDEPSDAPQIWDIDPTEQASMREQGAMTEFILQQ